MEEEEEQWSQGRAHQRDQSNLNQRQLHLQHWNQRHQHQQQQYDLLTPRSRMEGGYVHPMLHLGVVDTFVSSFDGDCEDVAVGSGI